MDVSQNFGFSDDWRNKFKVDSIDRIYWSHLVIQRWYIDEYFNLFYWVKFFADLLENIPQRD